MWSFETLCRDKVLLLQRKSEGKVALKIGNILLLIRINRLLFLHKQTFLYIAKLWCRTEAGSDSNLLVIIVTNGL